MKILRLLLVVTSVGLSFGCTTARLASDYDRDVDFSRYKTYSWLPLETDDPSSAAPIKNTIVDKRLKRAIAAYLNNKGYRLDAEQPDFYVIFHATVRDDRNEINSYPEFYHRGFYHGGHMHRYGYGFGATLSFGDYDEATLIIDVLDAATKVLLWRGWDRTPVYGPSIPEEKIQRAVRRILVAFPPD